MHLMNSLPVMAAINTRLAALDWVAIVLYFSLLLGVAWWVVSKNKNTASDYFLAGRNLGWWVIGASIFASNIGSEHIVGLAGSGAKSGVAMAHYELHAWCLLVLAWVFVPFYMRSQVFTMPEFLERRFSSGSRYVLSVVSIITFILSKIAVGIFAGGIVFSALLPELNFSYGDSKPFAAEQIKDPGEIIKAMRKTDGSNPLAAFVWTQCSEESRQALTASETPVEKQNALLADELNRALKNADLKGSLKQQKELERQQRLERQKLQQPEPDPVAPTPVRATTKKALDSDSSPLEYLNRLLLEDAFAGSVTNSIHEIDSFWIGSIAVIILTGLYTVIGGMRAVAYNDAVQVVVLIGGSAVLTFYGLHKLGGWGQLRHFCTTDMFNLWKPLVPHGVESTWSPVVEMDGGKLVKTAWYFNVDGHYPWLGMAICAPVIGLWYWCTDQYIVQRALGAPNEKVAREGSIFAAFLKLFPVYLFIIPGLICYALVKKNCIPEMSDEFNGYNGSQGAFPMMVKYLLPVGLRGIVVAGLLSALMGSLAGVFNACSTLFTVDIYEKWRPKASQAEIVKVGRLATIVMVIIALLWIPVVKGAVGLYDYLQSVQGYLAPPIFVVFFLGVFWKRLNKHGCFWAMVVGFIIGIFRMAVDTPCKVSKGFQYDTGSFLWIVNNINFQYFSILITLVSAIVMVVVSYMTPEPNQPQIQGLTFATATEEDKANTRASWNKWDVIGSLVIMAFIIGVYIYFTG